MKKNKRVKYTKEEKMYFKKRNKFLSLISSIVVGMFLATTVYFILNLLKLEKIEPVIRYIVIALLIILSLTVIGKNFKLRTQPKRYKFLLLILLLIIIGGAELYVSKYIAQGIKIVDGLNKSNNKIKYTSYLVAMKDSEVTKKNVASKKIGITSDTSDVEGYVLAQEIIKKNKMESPRLVRFDSFITMLGDLYDGEIEAAFIPRGYGEKYSGIEKFENIEAEVKVIDSYSKLMKKQVKKSTETSTKEVTEPFTMLVLGVDSTEDDISEAVALGDTIMVVTFNPNTLNATLFSIPRDTYVPISCYGGALSKITHAASGGDECMIDTVENFIDIDIDYYAKLNFKGLMNLVDALGGVYVDVPYSFCETDYRRTLVNPIFVRKGYQRLNGAEALALARNRKYYPTCGDEWNEGYRNDFVRGQNQQLVLKGIINKAKEIRTVDEFYKILETISISLDTNLSREQILGFYNVFKKILLSTDSLTDLNDVISIQRTYLNGGGGIIYDHIAGTGLYEFVPSTESLNAIISAMKINLELEEEEYQTSFSFSIDEPYEAEIIGEDYWGGITYYPAFEEPEETPAPTPTDSKCKASENRELGADNTTCVCKWGYVEDEDGVCVKDTESTCGEDEDYDEETDSCIPKSDETGTEEPGNTDEPSESENTDESSGDDNSDSSGNE